MIKHDPVLMVTVGVLEAQGVRFILLPGGRVGISGPDQGGHLLEGLQKRKRELYAFLKDRDRIREQYKPTARAALAIDQGAVAAEYLGRGEPFTLEGFTFYPAMFWPGRGVK